MANKANGTNVTSVVPYGPGAWSRNTNYNTLHIVCVYATTFTDCTTESSYGMAFAPLKCDDNFSNTAALVRAF
jgi:hypothetical protein